jgi:hypothetical protein
VEEFSIEYDNEVMYRLDALLVGSISSGELDSNQFDSVSDKFMHWIYIIYKEVAKYLPEYTSYNYAIDL